MDPNIKKSIISNGLDLGFGFANNLISLPFDIAREKRNYDLQFQYNEQAAQNAFDRQLEFWHLQNEYNTPAAQMRRLAEAGLNPALMNGGVSGNTAGNLSSVSSGSVGLSPQHDPIAKLLSVAELSHLFNQSDLITDQSKEILETIANYQLERTLKQIFGADEYLKIKDRAKTMGITLTNEDDLDEFFNVKSTSDGKSPLATEINLQEKQAESLEQQIAESQARINDMVATLPYRLEDIKSQVDFRDANIAQLEESAKLLRAEQRKIGLESDYLQLQNDNLALSSNASAWYGFDITRLPATLYRYCTAIYRDVMNGHISPQEGKNRVNDKFNNYMEKESHIVESNSYSRSFMSVTESRSHTR